MENIGSVELTKVDIESEFAKGLNGISSTVNIPTDVGKFLLLLANVYVDEQLVTLFQSRLDSMCALLSNRTTTLLADGRSTGIASDDLLVFLQAKAVGIDSLKPFARRRIGPWDVQFNHIRCFRPRRAAEDVPSGVIHREFNKKGFHFNRTFLQAECFARCTHEGMPIHLFYNKFPFHRGHALVVPEPSENREQYLTKPHLRQGWDVAQILGERHDIRLGYNSIGAYASVNHLHYQAIAGRLPVEDDCWKHNNGHEEYPASCEVFTDANSTWKWVADKQDRSVAYNLLLTSGKAYCFARRHQADYRHSEWTSGFAWYELSGSFIMFNSNDFKLLNVKMINEEMRLIRV